MSVGQTPEEKGFQQGWGMLPPASPPPVPGLPGAPKRFALLLLASAIGFYLADHLKGRESFGNLPLLLQTLVGIGYAAGVLGILGAVWELFTSFALLNPVGKVLLVWAVHELAAGMLGIYPEWPVFDLLALIILMGASQLVYSWLMNSGGFQMFMARFQRPIAIGVLTLCAGIVLHLGYRMIAGPSFNLSAITEFFGLGSPRATSFEDRRRKAERADRDPRGYYRMDKVLVIYDPDRKQWVGFRWTGPNNYIIQDNPTTITATFDGRSQQFRMLSPFTHESNDRFVFLPFNGKNPYEEMCHPGLSREDVNYQVWTQLDCNKFDRLFGQPPSAQAIVANLTRDGSSPLPPPVTDAPRPTYPTFTPGDCGLIDVGGKYKTGAAPVLSYHFKDIGFPSLEAPDPDLGAKVIRSIKRDAYGVAYRLNHANPAQAMWPRNVAMTCSEAAERVIRQYNDEKNTFRKCSIHILDYALRLAEGDKLMVENVNVKADCFGFPLDDYGIPPPTSNGYQ